MQERDGTPMRARHIFYGLAALVLSGWPLFWVFFGFVPNEDPNLVHYLLRWEMPWCLAIFAWLFGTGFFISLLADCRASRLAGLAAIPMTALLWFCAMGLLAILSGPTVLANWGQLATQLALLLAYPFAATALCRLTRKTEATPTWPGEAAASVPDSLK